MDWPMVNGPEGKSVVKGKRVDLGGRGMIKKKMSELFGGLGSDSAGGAVAVLSKVPAALMVAVKVIVVLAPEAGLGMVQGKAAQPPPVTFVMVRFVGVSVTWMLVAVEGPALATKRV